MVGAMTWTLLFTDITLPHTHHVSSRFFPPVMFRKLHFAVGVSVAGWRTTPLFFDWNFT